MVNPSDPGPTRSHHASSESEDQLQSEGREAVDSIRKKNIYTRTPDHCPTLGNKPVQFSVTIKADASPITEHDKFEYGSYSSYTQNPR